MNTKVITSFTAMTTSEGLNISFTFSEITPQGKKVIENERRTFIVMDSDMQQKVADIKTYIIENIID